MTARIDICQDQDFGSRYTQTLPVTELVNLNKNKYKILDEEKNNGKKKGISSLHVHVARNEDVVGVWQMPSFFKDYSGNMIVAAIADGHASVLLPNGHYVGGYEVAKNSVEEVHDSFLKLSTLPASKHKSIDASYLIFKKIFEAAHDNAVRASMSCIFNSDAFENTRNHNNNNNNDDNKNTFHPMSSSPQVDFIHSRKAVNNVAVDIHLPSRIPLSSNASRYVKAPQKTIQACVIPKMKTNSLSSLLNRNLEEEDKLCDYGCTLSVLLILPPHNQTKKIIVLSANVGDTEAYLFRHRSSSSLKIIELTTRHTVNNLAEVQRLAKYGTIVSRYPYFHIQPLGRQLMISRSIGHSVLQHFGILYHPTVSIHSLEKNDVIVFASDGVWDFLNPKSDSLIVDPKEDVVTISNNIGSYLKMFDGQTTRDNACWMVIKILDN